MIDWSTVFSIVIVSLSLWGVQYIAKKQPSWFSNDPLGDKLTDRVIFLEQRVAELESRQEFLVAELQKSGSKNMELQRQLDRLTKDTSSEESVITPVLVALGENAPLQFDLTAMRAVESETGLPFRRLLNASLENIKIYLDRARINGHPYDKLHLAVQGSSQGLLLGNEIVNSNQLSEILQGVQILLITGCDSSNVADFLGVVPYVISMTEKASPADSALFCRAFWTQIGRKKNPTDALRSALKAAPSGMSEYVEAHW